MKKLLSIALLFTLIPSLVFGQPSFQNFQDIKTYYTNKNVFVSNEIDELDFRATKEVLDGIEDVLAYYPQLNGILTSICTMDLDGGMMVVTQSGTLFISDFFFIDYSLAKENSDWTTGEHPKNSNIKSNGYHEMGHIIELYIIQHENPTNLKGDWESYVTAKNVVQSAISNVKQLLEYKHKSRYGIIEEISLYASETPSETIAEAVSDYFTNGDKSSVLSLYIIEELEKRMDNIQKSIDKQK